MKYRLKNIITLITLVLCFVFTGCNFNKDDNVFDFQQVIDNSFSNFKSANINITLTSSELEVYNQKTQIIKKDTGSLYSTEVKKLAQDLFSPSMYELEYKSGQLDEMNTKALLLDGANFKQDKLSNYKKEENKITGIILKENLMGFLSLHIQDVNKISNDGVNVEFILENERIIEYKYSYNTIDNIRGNISVKVTY